MSSTWGMTLDPAEDWHERARCVSARPEMFYPLGLDKGYADTPAIGAAKAFCDSCPVKGKCLAEALAHNDDHGIWGGLTPAERRALTGRQREPKPSRPRTVCGNGHALEGSNVRIEYGKQVCKTCHAAHQRISRARRRAQRQVVSHVR